MATFEHLRRRRAGIKGSLTILIRDIDAFLETASDVDIQARLHSLQTQVAKYETIQDEIAPLYPSDKEYLQDTTEDVTYLESVYVIIATLRKSGNMPEMGSSIGGKQDTGTKKKTGVKLPSLTLPTFAGDPSLWSGFWDMFKCVVHDNTDLSSIQKYTYLRGQLKGDAYKLVEGFTVEGSSYAPAVALLQDTFGHPDRIKAAHVLNFNGLRQPRCYVEELQSFYANMESSMRSIISQKVSLEEFCVVTLLNKLPSPTKETVRREMGDQSLDYKKFTTCLQAEIYNMVGSDTKRESTPTATATFTTQGDNRRFACLLCNGSNHNWYKCFKNRTAAQKIKRAKQLHLCLGCLASDHGSRGCTNPNVKNCRNCKGKHFHSLCTKPRRESTTRNSGVQEESTLPVAPVNSSTSTMSVSMNKQTTILPTVQLPVKGKERSIINVRSLLDQCSQRSFVKRDILPSLAFDHKRTEEIRLHGFTGTQDMKEYSIVELRYKHRGRFLCLEAIVVDELPEHKVKECLQVQLTSLTKKGIKLADPCLTKTAQLGILIGADHYYDIVRPGFKRSGDLILLPTKYGYALSGSYKATVPSSATEVITVLKLAVTPVDEFLSTGQYSCHKDLSTLWELDHIGIKPNEYSQAEQQALSTYDETVTYDPVDRQYQVRLPWTSTKAYLPTNKGLAIGRLRGLQKRFQAEPQFCSQYSKVISDQVSRGFVEEVPFDDTNSCHYLAHHGILKQSKTTPVRIVFDCSAKLNNHKPSLNECLYTGPSLVPDLAKVLLRFRLHKYAWVSDVEKAFLMLKLHVEDRDYTRFMWPIDPLDINSPLICYRFKVVLFGATCSQFLLNATILKHLSMVKVEPAVVSELKAGLYIDNLEGTGDCEHALVRTYGTACDVFGSAHLNLKEWATNSPILREVLNTDGVSAEQQDLVRVLGLVWRTDSDTLSFGVTLAPSELVTKRECLRMTAKLFDPLGILLPVTIRSRIFLQHLWRLKLSWDENLPDDLRQEWEGIVDDLIVSCSVVIPRRVFFGTPVSLHAFADASNKAYGVVIYFVDPVGSHLVMAKAKVAPIKSLSIPKLELTAVLLAARVVQFVEDAYQDKVQMSEIFMWSDSMITLHWLHSSKKLPVYVTNRVDEIHSLVPTAKYRYVSSNDNPSDMLSRGVSAKYLTTSVLWWSGPVWLTNQDKWPENITLQAQHEDVVSQVTGAVIINDTQLWNWEHFSSYEMLQRTTAWVLRFLNNLKAKVNGVPPTGNPYLSVNEIRAADSTLIKLCQKEIYSQEYSMLKKVAPSRNNLISQLGLHLQRDIIHCGGRLRYAAISESCKNPILLPSKHPLTHLFIDRCHRHCCHYGVGHIVTYIRQRFWIPKIRQVVKKVLNRCRRCRRVQSKPYDYAGQPPLPALQTTPGEPFKCTGVDYSGAITVKDSPQLKAYMVLFTCAITRSIHIEIVTNLTCDSFLHAFRRFCSRQGFPQIILSDNATTFVGASKYLKEVCQHPKFQAYLSDVKCDWRFIPARAPWFGAIWEHAIGIVKAGLKKVLGRALISLEEITTILFEIEAVVNDRPLYYASGDLEDPTPITPSMLIRGYRLWDLPDEVDIEDTLEDRDYRSTEVITARYRYIRKLSQDVWRRWSHEYLVTLREARRNKLRPINGQWPKVGDVVTIHDEGPRALWKLGRITELLPGRDGEVRVARVRTKTGIISRPSVWLYPLEGDVESEGDSQEKSPDAVPTVAILPDQNNGAAGGRLRRQAAQISSQCWRDKIASGQL